jgi:hypothetical protein
MGMWVGRGRKARAAYGSDGPSVHMVSEGSGIALVPGALAINPSEAGPYTCPLNTRRPGCAGSMPSSRAGRRSSW